MTITGPLTGRHVLLALLGFFGVMIAVNVLFVYLAVTTFGGLDTPDAYRKGLAYNATLEAASRQAELGWTTRLATEGGKLGLSVADRDGGPVAGLLVSGRLTRPATAELDRSLGGFEESRGGHYVTALDGLEPGAWIAELELRSQGGAATFRIKERLWLSPTP